MVAAKSASPLRLQDLRLQRQPALAPPDAAFPAANRDRQMFDRLDAGPFAPGNFRFIDRERQCGPTLEQGFQRASAFDARELMAKAEMDSGAEGDMPVRLSLQIEPFRMRIGLRVHVGGCQHDHDLVALSQGNAAEFDILPHVARFGELHRRDEPQKFLHRQIDAAPVFFEPVAQIGIFQQLEYRSADQVRGGLVPGKQQQEHHGDDFVGADLSAVFLDAHDLGDQPFTALPANGFEMLFDVALHRKEVRHHAEESERAGEAGEAAGPGYEFWPVGKRQPEQLRDHRQRQLARIALDEVGRAAFRKQFIGELVTRGLNVRLHVEHGAAAKRLVHDVAQPLVIRLVHRQHAVGKRAHDARHPPLQSGDRAILLRMVKVAVSFSTWSASAWVVVVQTLPMIGKRTCTTGPRVRSFPIAAPGSRK